METITSDYFGYIFAAYSVAAVVVIGMLILSLLGLKNAKKTLKKMKQDEA